MKLKNLFKKDPEEYWNPLHMGNYGSTQKARDADDSLSTAKLLRVLFECFPSFKTFDGDKRVQQFELLQQHFNIVHWKTKGDANNGKYFNSNYSHPIESPYLIVRFDNVKLRGRNVQNFGSIYCVMTASRGGASPIPKLTFWNRELNYYDYRNPDRESTKPDLWWSAARHPHISNSEACLGAFDNMMYKVGASGNILQYFELVRSFLFTWNRGSAYFNMNEFRPIKNRLGRTLLTGAQADKLQRFMGTSNFSQFRVVMEMLANVCDTEKDFINFMKVLDRCSHSSDYAMRQINMQGIVDEAQGGEPMMEDGQVMKYEGAEKYRIVQRKISSLYNRAWEFYGWSIRDVPKSITMSHPSHIDAGAKDGKMHFQWVLGKIKRYKSVLNGFLNSEPDFGPWDDYDETARPATQFRISFMRLVELDSCRVIKSIIDDVRTTSEKNGVTSGDTIINDCHIKIMEVLWLEMFPREIADWDNMFYAYLRRGGWISTDPARVNEKGPNAMNFKWLEQALKDSKIACGQAKCNSLTEYVKEIQNEIDTLKDDKQQDSILSVPISF
jgi:hypothetical protein